MSDFEDFMLEVHEEATDTNTGNPSVLIIDGLTPVQGVACVADDVVTTDQSTNEVGYFPSTVQVSVHRSLIAGIPQLQGRAMVDGKEFTIRAVGENLRVRYLITLESVEG